MAGTRDQPPAAARYPRGGGKEQASGRLAPPWCPRRRAQRLASQVYTAPSRKGRRVSERNPMFIGIGTVVLIVIIVLVVLMLRRR
jgi:hypothetical protein